MFLYPDDDSVKGSKLAFAALHAKMLERNVMAVCSVVPRNASQPRLAALIAQVRASVPCERVVC